MLWGEGCHSLLRCRLGLTSSLRGLTPNAPSVPCSFSGRCISPAGPLRVLSGWEGGVGSLASQSHPGKKCLAWQHCNCLPCIPQGAGLGLSPLFTALLPWEHKVTSLRTSLVKFQQLLTNPRVPNWGRFAF